MKHVLLALFAVFCYSYAMNYPLPETGYSRVDREKLNRLVADATVDKDWLTMLTEGRD